MQLASWQAKFEALGVRVAAMSYDDVAALADFAAANDVGYRLLADPGGRYMAALGIRNEEYGADHFAHGVPHPGALYVDRAGVVMLKRAVPGYRDRPDLDELLAAVAASQSGADEAEAPDAGAAAVP